MELFQLGSINYISILSYIINFAISITVFVLFIKAYLRLSKYNEISILKRGNAALSWALSGIGIGFAINIAIISFTSKGFLDMLIKIVISCFVQLLIYLKIPNLSSYMQEEIRENNNIAIGIASGGIFVVIGIINGASFHI